MLHKSARFLGIIFVASLFFSSCSTKPQPIEFGVDNCDFCKMTISDQRYGAELVTKKGRIYKFDDLHCIKGFILEGKVEQKDIASSWLVDFSQPETLIPAETSFLLENEELKSPMGSNIASFAQIDSFSNFHKNYSGTEIKWENYLKQE